MAALQTQLQEAQDSIQRNKEEITGIGAQFANAYRAVAMQNWLGPLIETAPSHPDLPDDTVLADAAKSIKFLCESTLLRFTVG
jgi:hypothetical protein